MAELAVITFSVNYLRSHPSHKHQGSMGYTLHFWPVVRNYQCLTHGQACMHSNSLCARWWSFYFENRSPHSWQSKFLLRNVTVMTANHLALLSFVHLQYGSALHVVYPNAAGGGKMIEIIQYELYWLLHCISQSMKKPCAVFINEKKSLVSWCGVVLIKITSCQSDMTPWGSDPLRLIINCLAIVL